MGTSIYIIYFFRLLALPLFLSPINISPLSAKNTIQCPNLLKDINFSINVIQKDIDYDLTVTQKRLTQIANRQSPSRSTQNEKVLGLTETGYFLSYTINSQIAQIAPNRYCARVVSTNIEIRITKLIVYVLEKYKRGSCQYNAIINHEHEHVATFQTGIKILEQKFRQKLWTILHRIKPGIGADSKQANLIVFRNLKNKILKIRRPIEKMIKARNNKIDTLSSYRTLRQQCMHW